MSGKTTVWTTTLYGSRRRNRLGTVRLNGCGICLGTQWAGDECNVNRLLDDR